MVTSASFQLQLSAAITTDDTTTAGGSCSGTQITNSAPGEWMPRLVAPSTGTLDTDAVFQIQEAYIVNVDTTYDAQPVGFYVANLLIIPGSAGQAKFQSSSASDDATKKIRVYGQNSATSLLDTEDITLNGVTLVTGTKSWTRIFRALLLATSDDSPVAAVGLISHSVGSNAIGAISPTYGVATSEREYSVTTSLGNSATFTNRVTAPAGMVWSRPNSPATQIYCKRDNAAILAHTQKQALYCRETIQPGMPPNVMACDNRIPYVAI